MCQPSERRAAAPRRPASRCRSARARRRTAAVARVRVDRRAAARERRAGGGAAPGRLRPGAAGRTRWAWSAHGILRRHVERPLRTTAVAPASCPLPGSAADRSARPLSRVTSQQISRRRAPGPLHRWPWTTPEIQHPSRRRGRLGRDLRSAGGSSSTTLDRGRQRDVEGSVVEPERSLVATDGEPIVGHAGAYTRELTVPGAILPAAHVTAVGVAPTHRRRGLLTRMMRRQLRDIAERRPRADRGALGQRDQDLSAVRLRPGRAAPAAGDHDAGGPVPPTGARRAAGRLRLVNPADAIAELRQGLRAAARRTHRLVQPRRPVVAVRARRPAVAARRRAPSCAASCTTPRTARPATRSGAPRAGGTAHGPDAKVAGPRGGGRRPGGVRRAVALPAHHRPGPHRATPASPPWTSRCSTWSTSRAGSA